MEFKNLSWAIADVINSYHADKTATSLVSVDLNAPLDTFVHILNEKIAEATTGSNSQSSRRTLLEYMLRGIQLCERAHFSENSDEIEALKPQFIQFFQNIQQLFKGPYLNMFTGSTFVVPADETNNLPSLSIYYLNTPSSKAYQLTHELLITLGLSPESPAAIVEKHVGELFFAKKYHVLLEENAELKAKLHSIKQTIQALEQEIDTKTSNTEAQVDEKKAPAEIEAHHWEMVGFNSEDEKVQHLLEKNEKLQKRYEELEERSHVLRALLNGLSHRGKPTTRQTSRPTPGTCNQKSATSAYPHVVTRQPKAETVATRTAAADSSHPTTRNRRAITRTGLLTNFLFSPAPYNCGINTHKTGPDPSLDKSNKIN
ncbi:MAG: hypothetical protein P1U39_02460 [Legionellaceae bacterium]|nr:hypothetical protein [Legionellaceae bacterium]